MQTLDGRAITVREDREDWSVKGSGGQERHGGGRGGGRGAPRPQADGAADKAGRQVPHAVCAIVLITHRGHSHTSRSLPVPLPPNLRL